MYYDHKICGKYTSLRSVTSSDKDINFIIELRTDEKRGRYIHSTPADVEFQRKWISEQQKKIGDYYFLILNSQDIPIGTVSIYNIFEKEAELGRWVSLGNALENMESVYLLHKWAFEKLDLEMIYTKTLTLNHKVVNFWRKFGATMIEEIDSEAGKISPGKITKDNFFNYIDPKIKKLLRY